MSKTKSDTKGAAAKASKKAVTAVKEGRVTKPAQTPKAKSKEIAKSAASKVDKKSKKSKKEPTPEPESSDSESESEADSDSGSDSSSESSSDEEVETKTKATKPAVVKKAESSDSSDSESEEDSDDSDSSDSDEEAAPKTNGAVKPAAKESSDSDSDSSDSESDEEEAPAKKAEATSDSDSDDSESDSEDSDSSDSEEETPTKKRKAEDEAEPVIKKAKTEEVADEGVKNLFVGNLSWSIDEDWLAREFEGFGEITGCRIITDRETQRPKGFGYVEFSTAEAAAKAKTEMHGKEVDGRALNVDFSTPRQNNNPKEKVGARAARFGDKPSVPSNTLFIGNLSFDSTNESIHEAFSAYGEISRVSLPTDRDTGNPKGFGYVDFGSVDEAKAALEALNGYEVDGRPIRVDYATPREDNGGGGGRGGRGGFGDRGGRGGGRGGFGGRGGGRGGRGGFGDRGGRGGGRGGRGGFSTNRGGFGDFQGKKVAF